MAPFRSVISIFPSGRNAMAHGLLSRPTTVSTVKGGEAFCGAGAFVWPGNAGFGAGKSEAFGAWARRGGASAIAKRHIPKPHANFLMDPPSIDRRQVTRSREPRQPRRPIAAGRFSGGARGTWLGGAQAVDARFPHPKYRTEPRGGHQQNHAQEPGPQRSLVWKLEHGVDG